MGNGSGDCAAGDFDFDWIDQAPLREGLDRGGHGGGEEQRLTAFPWADIDDFPHLREEAHVEHAIDFVEYEDLDFAEAHGTAVEAINEAAGCGDDNIGAFLKLLHLLAEADSTVEQGYFHAGLGTVFLKLLGDLVGEFAGWLKDEDLGLAEVLDLGKGRECECGGLAGARLGCADDVFALQDNRDGLCLNRGRIGVTRF